MLRLTRRYRFSASHRLHTPSLSEQQNRDLYGKCNNPFGHGHNYLLEVTVAGKLNESTGQLVAPAKLDALVDMCVLRDFDHKDLNSDVAEFRALVPTSENVTEVIRRRLDRCWNDSFPEGGPVLENIRLHETKRNRFELK